MSGKPEPGSAEWYEAKGIADHERQSNHLDDPFQGVTVVEDKGKYTVQTHRARWPETFDSPEAIPDHAIEFIRSTGALSPVEADADTAGVMLCLVPDEAAIKPLLDLDETTEPKDEAHITLLYLGSTEDCGGEPGRERIYRAMYDFGIHSGYRGLTGKVNGFGVFINEDEKVLWAAWDIPGIAEFRTHLVEYMRKHGAHVREDNHGFTPHQTLAYLEQSDDPVTLPELPKNLPEKVIFGAVTLSWGDEWQDVHLA